MEERSWGLWGGAGMKIREGRANVPEGLFAEEDSPARRRKSSTSKVASGLVERRRGSAPHQQSSRDECYHHHGDDYSDRGTYTIELDNGDHEEEEARKMIDKVGKKKLLISQFSRLKLASDHIFKKNYIFYLCIYLFTCLLLHVPMSQVFGVDEQEAVCVSRLGGVDQRERITSQRSGIGERGKPGHIETEVQNHESFNIFNGHLQCQFFNI